MEDTNTRVTRLEEQYNNINEKVDRILTNDLPHIQTSVTRIENKLAMWGGAIIILGIFGQYILDRLFR